MVVMTGRRLPSFYYHSNNDAGVPRRVCGTVLFSGVCVTRKIS